MLGLVIALLIMAWGVVVSKIGVEVAVCGALSFLWYWHVVIVCIAVGIVVLILLIGLFGLLCAGNTKDRLTILGGLAISPLVAIYCFVGSALFIGGVYCVMDAAHGPTGEILEFASWNIPVFVIGCVLYGVGCLRQGIARMSASTSSS